MSFVIAAPELVQSAAQSLAGIGSSLSEVTATAASPTTGVAAAAQDEVSLAIASMFGNVGQEFQALSAQAQAFHAQFVSAMNAGAAAYVSTEAANASQTLMGNVGQNISGVVSALQNGSALSGAVAAAPAAAPTLMRGVSGFWGAVAAPYQALVINTNTNLAAINSTYAANPHPFLTQIMTNQTGYAQTFASGIATDLQGFPGNVPANIQLAIQGASTFNPGALAAAFGNGQIGTAQTVAGSLQATGNAMMTGAPAFQAGVQTAFQDLAAGNPIGAYSALQKGLQAFLLPGFDPVSFAVAQHPLVPVVPLGPLGALAPIISLPGEMAQGFTNLLPPGSILAQMSQHATNVIDALTNLNTTINPAVSGGFLKLIPAVNFGVGLQLVFDAMGAPGNALAALNSTGVAFAGAIQAGNVSAAAAALLDAPANVTNGFLNGSTLITLPPVHATAFLGALPVPATAGTQVFLGGLLTPLSLPTLSANPLGLNLVAQVPGSSETGGLIPGLQSIGAQLAAMIAPTK